MAGETALRIGLAGAVLAAFALAREMRNLRREARHDPLTGLPNRRCLASAWQAIPGSPALLFIDLVGFKAVNDIHGHLVGDELLRKTALRLKSLVSRPATLVRWGGDEFVVVATEQQAAELEVRLAQMLPLRFDICDLAEPSEIGLSIGIVNGLEKLDAALAEANRRMMNGKNAKQIA